MICKGPWGVDEQEDVNAAGTRVLRAHFTRVPCHWRCSRATRNELAFMLRRIYANIGRFEGRDREQVRQESGEDATTLVRDISEK